MNATQKRFANDYSMTPATVARLVDRANYAGRCNERACNGDPFPVGNAQATDKNANMEAWRRELDTVANQIASLVAPYGFTEVVFTGLGPTLKRGEQFVEIPY